MYKIISLSILLLVFFVSLIAEDTKKYGEKISSIEKTNISEIIEKPESFVGKKVLVEGTVVNVCAKRGCWIELASEKEFETIRVKVQDGVIVFPMEAKGKKALVEGEVYSFNYETEAECSGSCMHGKESEENCEHAKKETKTIYQIRGIGAEI